MEELILQLQQLNTKLPPIIPLTTLGMVAIGIFAKALLSLKRAIDFHDEYFVKKRIKRIADLKAFVKEGQPITRFLDHSLETEIFRIDSGITASPARMKALIDIHDSGLWTVAQLRGAAKHLVIDNNTLKASIKISRADQIGALISLGVAILLLTAGTSYFVALVLTKTLIGFAVGVSLFGLFFIIGLLISYDYRSYRMALQIQPHLQNNEANSPDYSD